MSDLLVAFSLVGSGPHSVRGLVRSVAEELAKIYGREAIFYDEWYRAELSTADGAKRLFAKYQRAEVMVVFLTPDYGQRAKGQRWTAFEANVAFDRFVEGRTETVHLFMSGLTLPDLDELGLEWVSSTRSFPTGVEGRDVSTLVGDIVWRVDEVRRLKRLPAPRTATTKPLPRAAVREGYRQTALRDHGRVRMIGVGAADFDFGMADIYVPLTLIGDRPEAVIGGRRFPIGGDGASVGIEQVFEVVGDERMAAIMGDAGSGKTTALKKLVHFTLTEGPEKAGLPAGTQPRFVRAAELRTIFAQSNAAPAPGGRSAWMRGPLGALVMKGLTSEEQAELVRGPLLLLVDGLDELADPHLRDQALKHLEAAVAGDAGLWAMVSCRHSARGFDIDFPARCQRFSVQAMTEKQRHQLIERWFYAANKRDQHPHPAAQAQAQAAALAQEVGPVYALDPQLRSLVSTPLFATLQCVFHRANEFARAAQKAAQATNGRPAEAPEPLPQDGVTLLMAALELLLDRHERYGAEPRPPEATVDRLLKVLEDVAWRIQDNDRQDGLDREEWARWLWDAIEHEMPIRTPEAWDRWLGRHQPAAGRVERAAVCWFHQDANVLTELARDQLIFSHRGFQEVLAAVRLVGRGREGLELLAQNADGQTWRAPFLYAARKLGPRDFAKLAGPVFRRQDWTTLEPLLRDTVAILRDVDPSPFVDAFERGGPEEKRVIANLFQSRSDEALGPLRAAAERALATATDVDLRAALHRFLGRRAATEATPEVTEWVEPTTGMRFLAVRGGVFTMGADDDLENSRPAHKVRVSSFWLGETPVTNAQYRPYVEASGKAPRTWNNSRFNQDNQPVVGVSWHDGVAYCEWLSQRLGAGWTAQLPSEAWWERAARGDDGRHYPWGNETPDASRAWFGDLNGTTKPVGELPAGAGPYGHLDLAGNVWEWCRDIWNAEAYRHPPHDVGTPLDPVVAQGDPDGRPLRGGSLRGDPDGLRAAGRLRHPADSRLGVNVGFRVCLSPPSTGGSGGEAP